MGGLLGAELLVKPDGNNSQFLILERHSGKKHWANQAFVDVLSAASASVNLDEVYSRLLSKGYDSEGLFQETKSLWLSWVQKGWLRTAPVGPTHKLVYLPTLPSSYQMNSFTVCLTHNCNFDCTYCYNRHLPAQTLSKNTLFEQLNCALNTCGALSVVFTGGEPLLHPDIFDAIKFVGKHHRQCSLLTNGSLLTDDIIQELALAGLTTIGVSIDTLSTNKYNQITQTSFSPKQILNAMKCCVDHGIRVEANIVLVHGQNMILNQLLMLKDALEELGIVNYVVSEATPTSGHPHSYADLADKSFQKEIVSCLGQYSCPDSALGLSGQRFCGIGRTGLVLQPNGNVLVCPALSNFPVGNINNKSLDWMWCNSSEIEAIRSQELSGIKVCAECTSRSICGGGCRAKSYHYYGDLWSPDPISCIQYGIDLKGNL